MISPQRESPSNPLIHKILIAGCGDIGRRVARLWLDQGAEVHALSHSRENRDRLSRLGIRVWPGDLDKPDELPVFNQDYHTVYYLAPPPDHGQEDPRLQQFLARLETRPGKIIYISTSGVYGDQQGGWVDETSTTAPNTDRSRRRLAAEAHLQAWCSRNGVMAVILRVGGIYGPGRLPLERLKQGRPVLRPDQAPYSNRIHADDLARVCLAAAERSPGGIYNVSDGQPDTMSNYFLTVARLAGLPQPELIDWQTAQQSYSPEMLSYIKESRRLNTDKMRRELMPELLYPDLESGLRAIFSEEAGQHHHAV